MLNEKKSKEAIEKVAADENVSVSVAREEMEKALLMCFNSENPETRAALRKLFPDETKLPTLEEFIAVVGREAAKEAKERETEDAK